MPIVFVFGDFNGRTKDLLDFIQHDELHEAVLDNLPTYSEDILLPTRTNSDQGVNDNGRRLLTLCKSTGIGIVNGRHPGGFSNDFTFCGPRGLSTFDYLLSTADMLNFVEKIIVCNFNTFSRQQSVILSLCNYYSKIKKICLPFLKLYLIYAFSSGKSLQNSTFALTLTKIFAVRKV